MPPSNMRPRTIQFYEIVMSVDAEQVRMETQPWQEVLGHLATADLASRTWESDRTILGQVYPLEEIDRLLLHKVRDGADWLSRVDFQTAQISEVEAEAGTGYLDSSAIHFVEFGNIVALMQGSVASPSHKTLEGWLNKVQPFDLGSGSLVVRPLVSPGELERLQQATQVSRFEIKLGKHFASTLKGKQGNLAKFLRRSKDFGDVDITVVISVPRGKKKSQERIDLANDLNEISDVIPSAAAAARATLMFGPEDAVSAGRITELVEHHITAKRNVRGVDDDGNSIRFAGAFQVMETVIYELEDQLKAAADIA